MLELGGLFICGTERHESRRIDNQLRGRVGPPGRPGRVALLPLRRGRADPAVRRRPHLQDPRPPGPGRRGRRGVSARGEDAQPHGRERAEEGRAAELPDPKARPRVRRRDERAAAGRLQVPARDPRGPRHVGGRARRRSARWSSGWSSEYTAGEVFEDWDLAGLETQAASLALSADLSDFDGRDLGPRGDRAGS